MKTNKHIAMWACPRSRSTVISRAFENLDGCIVYDEPLFAPYVFMTTYTTTNSRTLEEENLTSCESPQLQGTPKLGMNSGKL
uniref:Truncated SxtN n=1 Tax=Heteroscytonema crispum UCFS10 TaxID=1885250 RepID=A0A3G2KSB8_9CYAN|nr:truncated SxtN [Heteroscytonema crispum UCFS10]